MANDPTPPRPTTLDPSMFDAYAPPEIARSVQLTAMTKAKLAMTPLLGLSVLAGAFISFGAMFYTLVITGAGPGFGPPRLLGGIAFSLGLVLVLVGGAELFTGNSLMVMGWADRKVTTRDLLRNWIVCYTGNFAGAIGIVAMAAVAGMIHLGGDAVGLSAVKIAAAAVGNIAAAAAAEGIGLEATRDPGIRGQPDPGDAREHRRRRRARRAELLRDLPPRRPRGAPESLMAAPACYMAN